jgi:hypothetical protein
MDSNSAQLSQGTDQGLHYLARVLDVRPQTILSCLNMMLSSQVTCANSKRSLNYERTCTTPSSLRNIDISPHGLPSVISSSAPLFSLAGAFNVLVCCASPSSVCDLVCASPNGVDAHICSNSSALPLEHTLS